MGRQYYAYRKGATQQALDYNDLRRLVVNAIEQFEGQGLFQHLMGKNCPDDARDIGAFVLEKVGRELWPFSEKLGLENEQWLFTAIEFLYDHSAEPTSTYTHQYMGCGLHVRDADSERGQRIFRERMNSLLARYVTPYELQESGEIWTVPPNGLAFIEPAPTSEPAIDDRVKSALRSYRLYGGTGDDKRHAIHDLADVLERLKKSSTGTMLPTKDESDLFQIANRFGIRHHDLSQKTDYDTGPWLDWIFYSFLNAVTLATRLLDRSGSVAATGAAEPSDLPF